MPEKIIDIKAESFPWPMRLIGALLVLAALVMMMSHGWVSSILVVLGVFLISGYSGTEIDVSGKTLREYNSYLYIRTGAKKKYDRIERIFINKGKVTEKMYTAHTNGSATFRYVIYNAYLKMDNEKIFLTSRKDKDQLIRLLNPIVVDLGTELIDHTV